MQKKKLIAFVGLDPSIHQSGKFLGASKLSKRGNRHLRREIYLNPNDINNRFCHIFFIMFKTYDGD
jgi:transposase